MDDSEKKSFEKFSLIQYRCTLIKLIEVKWPGVRINAWKSWDGEQFNRVNEQIIKKVSLYLTGTRFH